MRSPYILAASAVVLVGIVAAPEHRAAAAKQSRYVAIDLGATGGSAIAWAINNRGQIVGHCGERSFLWEDGVLRDLGVMEAWGINERGDVVGNANGRAVVWERGVLRHLPTPGAVGSVASSINNRGQIVGVYTTSDWVEHACLWDRGQMIDLGAPAVKPPYSRATGINEHGEILGFLAPDAAFFCAFVWRKGVLDPLCQPPVQSRLPAGITSRGDILVTGFPSILLTHKGVRELPVIARGISSNGLVACEFMANGQVHACLWDDGEVTDLGVFFDGWSVALAANTRGELVGWFYDQVERRNHAVLWRPAP